MNKQDEKPVDFAAIKLRQEQTLVIQYLMGAVDNWRKANKDVPRHSMTKEEVELMKASDRLQEMVSRVYGRSTIAEG